MTLLRCATIAEQLPAWQAPYDDQGFAVAYAQRATVDLRIDPDGDTLHDVLARAVAAFAPILAPGWEAVTTPFQPYWVWWYLDGDDAGWSVRPYEMAEDLVTVDIEGRGHWNRTQREIPYGDIVRSAEAGLLRGDPLRPYIALVIPQGDGGFHDSWQAAQAVWSFVEHALAVRDVAVLLGGGKLARRLKRRRMIAADTEQLAKRGGSPVAIQQTLSRKARWTVGDLRILTGASSDDAAAAMLDLFGYATAAHGCYEMDASEEARLLRLIDDEAFGPAEPGGQVSDRTAHRVRFLLQNGTAPPADY